MIDWGRAMTLSAVRAVARYLAVISCVFFIAFNTISASFAQNAAQEDAVSYQYDDLGRLVGVVYAKDGRSIKYTYDDAGNRKEHVVSDALPLVQLWNPEAYEGEKLTFGVFRLGSSTSEITVDYETYSCTNSSSKRRPL